MKSSVTKSFRKQLDDLPASVQEQANKAYVLWHCSTPYRRKDGTPVRGHYKRYPRK